ncbi:MAG TPA: DNA mismatch repair protein MutS [Chloroflexota bacterium]|nr:DNA mismatch repair protein MutS [Chloroflexota bacterium]
MVTPARQQYLSLKAQHPDALLWFRMGDFYELFDEDARIAARELKLTLTSREFGRGERVPMAGIPYHAAESYLARLVRKGYRVAIAEQVSPPGRGLVERVVTRVVSAGTVIEPGMLPARANNYLAAVVRGPARRDGTEAYGLAYVDVTTGEFAATELAGAEALTTLQGELGRLAPAECLVPWDQASALALPGAVTRCDAWRFDPEVARERLLRQFGVRSLESFGCADRPLAIGAAGAVLAYLEETNPALLPLLTGLRTYSTDAYMALDAHTRRNLELLRSARTGSPEGSLLAVLDVTRTPMGGRLLRRWLGQPLLDVAAITARQEAVAAFVEARALRAELLASLNGIGDLERLTSRALQGVATPRELLALREILLAVAPLRERLAGLAPLAAVAEALDPCADVADEIGRAVADDAEGRLIRPGYDAARDELVASIADTRRWLAELEGVERERTGIRSLKVGYNQVFGYYIEVTHPNRDRVPPDYIRKQTLANAERYITPQLKEAEARILHAEERIEAVERALFAQLLSRIGAQAPRLLRTADALAQLDVYLALAEVADRRGYVRPEVHTGDDLLIEGGRHPVVEAALGPEAFIPNDCQLGGDGPRIALVTGPNMAGKSTYLRQVALIVLMAQVGSFVPARRARIGIVDRIFTRIGAQDDLAAGASTFMVEMEETAAILRHATPRSLVVLDEIGRGTSTQDGLAIARAVIEYLHDRVGARGLFATHFHELIELAAHLPRLCNLHTAVREENGQVVFLHRVLPGGSDRSYGLHVARLAGLPAEVLERAAALLAAAEPPARERAGATLPPVGVLSQPPALLGTEADGAAEKSARALVAVQPPPGTHNGLQPGTSSAPPSSPLEAVAREVLEEILSLDLCHMTPLEALNRLAALQQRGRRGGTP